MKIALLDTNAYTAMVGGDAKVSHALSGAEEVLLSVFVLGELHVGFFGGTKMRRNLADLEAFLARDKVRVLDATTETAEVFGRIKVDLTKAGTPIPVDDIWIAAHALQTGSVLVTYDRHFLQVPGLRVWAEL